MDVICLLQCPYPVGVCLPEDVTVANVVPELLEPSTPPLDQQHTLSISECKCNVNLILPCQVQVHV